MSIRLRLAISHALLAVGVFVLVGGLLYIFFEHSVRSEVDDSLRDRAIATERAIQNATTIDEAPAPAGGTGRVRIFTTDGALLAQSPATEQQQVMDETGFLASLDGESQTITTSFNDGERRVLYYPTFTVDTVETVIEVSESLQPTERALSQARLVLLIAGILALPGGLLAGWWMAREALIPVNRLSAAVSTLASTGEFNQRVTQSGADDEIGRLARTFNDILGRLTVVLDRQQTLVADTSHELRNPLMVVRGNLDLLVHELPADQRLEAVNEAREEVDRMARLVGDLLFLADADTQGSIQRDSVELDDVLAEVVRDARMFSPDHVIDLNANDPVLVLGDAERLRQLIWNLVENAIRYTPAGGTINLALRRRSKVAEISVSDTGIGIPEEHLPHIFDRFYRVDRGRSRALGGTGLGLAIVRQVVEAHGGHVRVRSIPNIGSTFTVFLPLSETPEVSGDGD
jgi:two-component system, OmpR family, sensor kinase